MFTSNFASLKKVVEAGLEPVAISIGLPKWYSGRRVIELAPSRAMLKMSREMYDRKFAEILRRLDPEEMYRKVGSKSVMLCYEKHNDWCHRRMVADWFENELGISVPEFGFDRNETLPYEQCGCQPKKEAQPVVEERQPDSTQTKLF